MASFRFGKDFMLGFSMSGFQFEMGVKGSEDPYSDWWVWVRDPFNIASGMVSGDLPEHGCGYWKLYKTDHDIADRLGMDTARFCIEWSRIFPRPTFEVSVDVDKDEDGNIVSVNVEESHLEKLDKLANKDAVEHYRRILSDWRNRDKRIILNLNHFTLPIWIHDPIMVRDDPGNMRAPRGWLSDRAVIEFAKYAAYIAWRFDDLVDYWSTMNEPNVVYTAGYINVSKGFPPSVYNPGFALQAAYNMIQAHARAYDCIRCYSKKPIGIIYAFTWADPLKEDDREASVKALNVLNYMFLDAVIYGRARLGFEWRSIDIDRDDLKNRVDWIGLNYYTRIVVSSNKISGFKPVPGYGALCVPGGVSRAGRPVSDSGWEVYPEGLYMVLRSVYRRYGKPIIITENGIADKNDTLRPRYVIEHLYMVHKALSDGVDVRGYLVWSLIDNYEWSKGFSMRFGLVHVDYDTKRRFVRPSALVFKEIALSKSIPEDMLSFVRVIQH